MRAIICGGRKYTMDAVDWWRLDAFHAAEPGPLGRHGCQLGPLDAVYEGGANGADKAARAWAESRGVPVVPFPAEWSEHGNAAGPLRNMAMLAGHAPEGCVPEAEMVIRFPGGVGTANMVAQARAREVPVLDLGLPRAQRWTPEHITDLRNFANSYAMNKSASVDEQRRAALRACVLAHGGLGIPCASAHLFRAAGTDQIHLPPGSLYVGRAGMIGARHMWLPGDGDGSALGNPFKVKPGMSEEQGLALLTAYRDHLRELYRSSEPVRLLLDRIAAGGTLLVCWCHADKPCHTTIIAEAALLVRAQREMRAKGLPSPREWSTRSRATPRAFAVGLSAGAAS